MQSLAQLPVVKAVRMQEIRLPPFAPTLIESMRAVGYSFESAMADLIDNSITAGATLVEIRFAPPDCRYIAILDNGLGMSPEELTAAMRHGSTSPLITRSATDLGRFGLGLKTASLSQCRRLTVASFRDGVLSARRWDLDVVSRREDWILEALEHEEIACLADIDRLQLNGHGTLVVWESFDRLAAGYRSVAEAVEENMTNVRQHLGLTFHRFIAGELPGQKKLVISVNNDLIDALDPFLENHRATQILPEETIIVENAVVTVQPYILPHQSKLSKADMELAGGERDLHRDQGFYIYRSRRLLLRGTWFRFVAAGELTKLARVRVNIPNSLDHLWNIDIRKSVASPPTAVRRALSRVVDKIAEGSRRVFNYRGRIPGDKRYSYAWEKVEFRDGISYRINREHPLADSLAMSLPPAPAGLLASLLDTLETALPLDAIYADLAKSRSALTQDAGLNEDLLCQIAQQLAETCKNEEEKLEALLSRLPFVEPFCLKPEFTEKIIAGLRNGLRKRR
jgi:hypothetical protein